jgi:hypothetical protein
MDELVILFSPAARGRWRALVLRCPHGLAVEGFNTRGAAFNLDEPDFDELERQHPHVGYHRRELPNGTIRVSFPAKAVLGAVDWLERAVAKPFEQVG